jgi:hypothetical protein
MTTQNTSSAVMQQRKEPRDGLDFFPTPPWATRALCERLERLGFNLAVQTAWDPACGAGDMQRALAEHFGQALASDVRDYGAEWRGAGGLYGVCDYLIPAARPDWLRRARIDWVITNPPFRLAQEFVEQALTEARVGVAMLVRTAFLEGQERYRRLFGPQAPWLILQFTERVVMAGGRLRDPEVPYLDRASGTVKRPSTATAYAWVVWWPGGAMPGTRFDWIDPDARARLTRPGDYPPLPPEERVGPVAAGGLDFMQGGEDA